MQNKDARNTRPVAWSALGLASERLAEGAGERREREGREELIHPRSQIESLDRKELIWVFELRTDF